MWRRAALLAMGLLLVGCLAIAVLSVRWGLAAARSVVLYHQREAQEEARAVGTLTAEAQGEERPAPALTAGAVVAALRGAGLETDEVREGCNHLASSLAGAERCYYLDVIVGGGEYEVGVLSYGDNGEATRVARRVREIYRSTQGTFSCYAMCRGPVVVTVSPVDEALVARVRVILDGIS
ncbi:MAG: hypothetical protein QME94_16430 [Anaerolineae bacterium]|nr:hypothetical protein [Anaerolineae bacterium]